MFIIREICNFCVKYSQLEGHIGSRVYCYYVFVATTEAPTTTTTTTTTTPQPTTTPPIVTTRTTTVNTQRATGAGVILRVDVVSLWIILVGCVSILL